MNKEKYMIMFIAVSLITAGCFMYKADHTSIGTSTDSDISISAGQAVLADGKTGEILYEKSADERAYPASTTKIMTAMLTLETLKKYDSPLTQTVEIPEEAAGVEGSSLYLKAGEKISMEDLLYGLMLVSGNDAATALACIIGGTQEDFVKMMNEKSAELHCSDTHFTNPSGLFDEDHYTTARDMAVIAGEAMKDPDFRKIVSTKDHRSQRTDSDYINFHNKNKTIFEYDGGTGVKIGYTKASGRTLVASASREGRSLICVVMSAPDWFNDAYSLMDMGFSK